MNKWLSIPLPTQTTIGCIPARSSTERKKNKQTCIWGNDINDNRPCTMEERFMSLTGTLVPDPNSGVLQLNRLHGFFSILLKPEKEVPGSRAASEFRLLKETWGSKANGLHSCQNQVLWRIPPRERFPTPALLVSGAGAFLVARFSSLSPPTRASPRLRGKESPCQCRRHRTFGFSPWVGKIPWRRKWQPTWVFLPGNPMDRGACWATAHGVAKSQTWLSTHTIPYSLNLSATSSTPAASTKKCLHKLSNFPVEQNHHPTSTKSHLLHTDTSWGNVRISELAWGPYFWHHKDLMIFAFKYIYIHTYIWSSWWLRW